MVCIPCAKWPRLRVREAIATSALPTTRSRHIMRAAFCIDAILRQHELIDALNDEFGQSFRILKGIESDIHADGSLDYAHDVLARFDFVVASVHSDFRGAK